MSGGDSARDADPDMTSMNAIPIHIVFIRVPLISPPCSGMPFGHPYPILPWACHRAKDKHMGSVSKLHGLRPCRHRAETRGSNGVRRFRMRLRVLAGFVCLFGRQAPGKTLFLLLG